MPFCPHPVRHSEAVRSSMGSMIQMVATGLILLQLQAKGSALTPEIRVSMASQSQHRVTSDCVRTKSRATIAAHGRATDGTSLAITTGVVCGHKVSETEGTFPNPEHALQQLQMVKSANEVVEESDIQDENGCITGHRALLKGNPQGGIRPLIVTWTRGPLFRLIASSSREVVLELERVRIKEDAAQPPSPACLK